MSKEPDGKSRQVERIVMPICEDGLKIIYKHNKPYGIRDSGGFLFFFADISKYSGQEERYRQEIEQQYKLADYLLAKLKQRHIGVNYETDHKKKNNKRKRQQLGVHEDHERKQNERST